MQFTSIVSVRPILNTALLLTGLGMIVRASGAVKEILFARAFGVSAETDAFVVAVTYAIFVPTVLGGSIATALITERSRLKASSGHDLKPLALWVVAAALACGFFVYLSAPVVMANLFSLEGGALEEGTRFLRILSPLGTVMVLSIAMNGLLNSEKQFYVAGLTALGTPVFTMIGILLFADAWGVEAAAWGMLVGGFVELGVLSARIASQQSTFFPARSAGTVAASTRAFWHAVAMLSFAAGVSAIQPMVDQFFLARLETGAVTQLSYASKVNSLLIGLFGTAFGAAIFPYLSDLVAHRDIAGLKRLTWRLAAVVIALSGVTTLLVYIFSYEIVQVLFARGNFTERDTVEVSAIQQMFALQLVFYVAGLIVMRVLNAAGAASFIVAVSFVTVISNGLLDWLLYEDFGARGIALAAVLASVISLGVSLALVKPALARGA